MSILGVTLHVCDGNGILRRVFLGLCELNGSHTGTAMRRELNKMLAEYGLSMKDVFKVITDGASNMANAFRDVFSVEVMIQYLEDYNEEETEKADEVSSDCRNSVLSIESAFPLRVKCFAHDIQLVIVEMFKNYDQFVPEYSYLEVVYLSSLSSFSPGYNTMLDLRDN
uniref:DUF4371 domain-containing protein n=1 Tax=Ditylenchus dipsaci TaxID=166011 RepID=A0A915EH30_9BILA